MEVRLDPEVEAKAADELVRNLEKIDAPRVLIDHARTRAIELNQEIERRSEDTSLTNRA